MTYDTGATTPDIDPDPFTFGLGFFTAMTSGISFLEVRRQSRREDERARLRFASAWYAARRAVISFTRVLDEYETYVVEDGYGGRSFRLGTFRLLVPAGRVADLKRLRGRMHATASEFGDSLDALSDHLGPEHQPAVEAAYATFQAVGSMPERFADLVTKGREAVIAYTELLDDIAAREGFEVEVTPIGTARSRREREPPPT